MYLAKRNKHNISNPNVILSKSAHFSFDKAASLMGIELKKAKLADKYLSKLQYLQADFENYKKRAEKEKENWRKYSNETLIKNFLFVLDNFEQALANIPKDSQIMTGLKIIFKQFWKILESEGLKPIKAVGEKFDPFKHEALMVVENKDKEEDTIIEQIQKGYMLHTKVIRPSKVMVAKKPKECEKIQDENKESPDEEKEKNTKKNNENMEK